MKTLLILLSLCLPLIASEKIKVLIIDGFNNHDAKLGTQVLSKILLEAGGFSIDVSTVPEKEAEEWSQWNPTFSDYDVVIQNTNDIGQRGKVGWTEAAQKGLETFISEGGGMYCFHSANNAFLNWEEYNKMIGMGWRPKKFGKSVHILDGEMVIIPAGKGDKTGHGPKKDTTVYKFGNHPIHAEMPEKWTAINLETYRYPRGPVENLTVLSYALEEDTGLNFPIEWITSYGKGRVYSSTYGHLWDRAPGQNAGADCPAFIKIVPAVVKWLAGE